MMALHDVSPFAERADCIGESGRLACYMQKAPHPCGRGAFESGPAGYRGMSSTCSPSIRSNGVGRACLASWSTRSFRPLPL